MTAPSQPLTDTRPHFITGATGKTGRRIVARLESLGQAIRSGSRSASQPFDWTDRSTWRPCLTGAQSAYIAYQPDVTAPGGLDAVTAFATLAMELGVDRLVLLTGRGEAEAQAAERRILKLSPHATVVRCSWFNQNLSEDFMAEMIRDGVLALPAGDAREPFVDADDIAEVVVAALTATPGPSSPHAGRIHELSGPEALTFHQVAQKLSNALGRGIRYVPLTREQFEGGMVEAGVPDSLVKVYSHVMAVTLDGRNEATVDGVQQAIGRPAKSFDEFVARTAATGAWQANATA